MRLLLLPLLGLVRQQARPDTLQFYDHEAATDESLRVLGLGFGAPNPNPDDVRFVSSDSAVDRVTTWSFVKRITDEHLTSGVFRHRILTKTKSEEGVWAVGRYQPGVLVSSFSWLGGCQEQFVCTAARLQLLVFADGIKPCSVRTIRRFVAWSTMFVFFFPSQKFHFCFLWT